MQLLRDFIAKLPADEIVCVIDAYDVILLQPLSELEASFTKLSNDVVLVSGDKAQDWTKELYGKYLFGTCHGRRLSAGSYVGRALKLLWMMESMLDDSKNTKPDDQLLMTRFCNRNQGQTAIDVDRRIFITIANHYNQLDLQSEGIRLNTHKRWLEIDNGNQTFYPCILHAPALTRIDNMLDALGYPVPLIRDRYRVHGPPFTVLVLATVLSIVIASWMLRSKAALKRLRRWSLHR